MHNSRYRRSPTPYKIDTITLNTDKTSTDTKDIPVQLNKCKNRISTPLPGKLFTFPTFSNSEDLDATCNELLLPDTSSETESIHNYRILPVDTDFLPFQDHSRHLPRPSCIPVPIKQLIKPCSTQRKENKDTTHIHKAKPSCIPVYKDKKYIPVIRDNQPTQPKELQTSNSTAVPSNQSTAKQPAHNVTSSKYTLAADQKVASTTKATCIH